MSKQGREETKRDADDRECDPCAIPPGFIATTIAIHLGRRMGRSGLRWNDYVELWE